VRQKSAKSQAKEMNKTQRERLRKHRSRRQKFNKRNGPPPSLCAVAIHGSWLGRELKLSTFDRAKIPRYVRANVVNSEVVLEGSKWKLGPWKRIDESEFPE
jgi:hypothetical protein